MNLRRTMLLLALLLVSPVFAADPIKLQAGKLDMVFEPDTAMLRYVRIGDHLILQGISAPVRDKFWGTVPPEVKNVRLKQENNSFTLHFDVSCRQREIDFVWQGSLAGTVEGRIVFAFEGVANSEFLRNRIGFCVLHGAEAAGRPCVVETVAGETVKGNFPTFISPHQPFKDIRAIKHEVADGVWANVRMEGDTFEMEDQRNWTDASFKTYCTPLALPFPVKVEKGTKISHRIEISVEGGEKVPESADTAQSAIVRVVGKPEARRPLPKIGLQVSKQTDQLSDAEVARLRELHLHHLRVDLTPFGPKASDDLRRAAQQASQLETRLVVGLYLNDKPVMVLQRLRSSLVGIQAPSAWLLIGADVPTVTDAREFLKLARQQGRVGLGEDTNFTELNRKRPNPKHVDVVSYGMNPQIHAFDNASMVETLAIQGDTVRSARQFLGNLPLMVSPITLRKQAVDQPPAAGELPSFVDPRQTSLFAAAWTVGSIKYLAEAGVEALTYYETVGWRGVMESENGSPLPDRFPSQPGQLFPIYHVLQQVGKFAGGYVRETTSTRPMAVVGLVVEKDNESRLLLANLTPNPQSASVQGFNMPSELHRLKQNNSPFEVVKPEFDKNDQDGLVVNLAPYEVAVLVSR